MTFVSGNRNGSRNNSETAIFQSKSLISTYTTPTWRHTQSVASLRLLSSLRLQKVGLKGIGKKLFAGQIVKK